MGESLADLIKLQLDRISTNDLISDYYKVDTIEKNNIYFKTRIKRLEDIFGEFMITHKRIVCLADSDSDYFKDEMSMTFENSYFDIFGKLSEAQSELLKKENQSTSQSNPQIIPQEMPIIPPNHRYISTMQPPLISVAEFSGRFTDWPSFNDSFTRLVYTNFQYNIIQKFHLLKLALPKSSDLDIHSMSLTEENYSTAWDLLKKRYENPRVLFMHHMNKLQQLPIHSEESSQDIKTLLNEANMCINGLKRLKIPIQDCDHWLAHILSTKLAERMHKAWEHHLSSRRTIPTFADFETFLNNRSIILDAIENRNVSIRTNESTSVESKNSNLNSNSNSKQQSKSKKQEKKVHALTKAKTSSSSENCVHCGSQHTIRSCPSFLAKDCFERKSIAEKCKLCYNCLSKSHALAHCPSPLNCRICGQRHHTLLHFPVNPDNAQIMSNSPAQQSIVKSVQNTTPSKSTQVFTNTIVKRSSKILLSTALVKVINPTTQKQIMLRALVDDGSEGSAISEQAVQILGLKRTTMHTSVSGVSSSKSSCNHVTDFMLGSCVNSEFSVYFESALVLHRITSDLPTKPIIPQNWPHIEGLVLADPTYYQPGKIDLLIGSEMLASIFIPQMKIGLPTEPIAQNSHLGWLLSSYQYPIG